MFLTKITDFIYGDNLTAHAAYLGSTRAIWMVSDSSWILGNLADFPQNPPSGAHWTGPAPIGPWTPANGAQGYPLAAVATQSTTRTITGKGAGLSVSAGFPATIQCRVSGWYYTSVPLEPEPSEYPPINTLMNTYKSYEWRTQASGPTPADWPHYWIHPYDEIFHRENGDFSIPVNQWARPPLAWVDEFAFGSEVPCLLTLTRSASKVHNSTYHLTTGSKQHKFYQYTGSDFTLVYSEISNSWVVILNSLTATGSNWQRKGRYICDTPVHKPEWPSTFGLKWIFDVYG